MRDHAKEFSLFGNGVSLAGGALSALNQYQAGKAQKAAGLATADNMRREAQGAYDSALADEYLQNCNYSEFFVSGIYNVMCKKGLEVRNYTTDFHVPFGTPIEYEQAQNSEYFEVLK